MNAIIEMLRNFATLITGGQLQEWGAWSYFALAVLVAFEGPVATLFGAAAAATGVMRPLPVFASAAIGNLTADSLWYTIGYLGKVEWFLRFGRRLGISQVSLERLQQGLHQHTAKVLFLAKLSVGPVIPSLIATGLVKVPWWRWFPSVFGAEMVWTGALVLIGYYAAQMIKGVERGLEYIVLAATALFILFVVWLGRRILSESPEN
jgi:membrane protein DedA with SNARE-associated domain